MGSFLRLTMVAASLVIPRGLLVGLFLEEVPAARWTAVPWTKARWAAPMEQGKMDGGAMDKGKMDASPTRRSLRSPANARYEET